MVYATLIDSYMEKKKHVFITGGAKGIGAATARAFYDGGYNVVIADIDDVNGIKLKDELGEACLFISCDVSKSDQVKKAIKYAIDQFGEIEVLVNNAGINPYGTVTETTDELWDKVMDVNLKSHFICARECIPSMLRNKRGVVVDVASVQALMSQNKVAAYTTSKSALLGLVRSIAVDYSPIIRSVAICPGSVDTPLLRNAAQESPDPDQVIKECEDMHLSKRIAKPEEIADLIFYVASEKADFITGRPIRIDGGLGIRIAGSKQND